MRGANTYLKRGLQYADGLVKANDYFTIYNRHEELRALWLSESGYKPGSLDELLKEAHVIRYLNKGTPTYSSVNTWPEPFSIP